MYQALHAQSDVTHTSFLLVHPPAPSIHHRQQQGEERAGRWACWEASGAALRWVTMGPHLLRAKAFLFASSLFLFLPFLLFLNRSSGRGARELGSYGGLRLRGLGLGSGGLLGGWRWRGACPHLPSTQPSTPQTLPK